MASPRSVNDCVERGVALMTTFNEKLTGNEEQKQFLLQVVQQHRIKYPESIKQILIASMFNHVTIM